jgi:hypothetical protein
MGKREAWALPERVVRAAHEVATRQIIFSIVVVVVEMAVLAQQEEREELVAMEVPEETAAAWF